MNEHVHFAEHPPDKNVVAINIKLKKKIQKVIKIKIHMMNMQSHNMRKHCSKTDCYTIENVINRNDTLRLT